MPWWKNSKWFDYQPNDNTFTIKRESLLCLGSIQSHPFPLGFWLVTIPNPRLRFSTAWFNRYWRQSLSTGQPKISTFARCQICWSEDIWFRYVGGNYWEISVLSIFWQSKKMPILSIPIRRPRWWTRRPSERSAANSQMQWCWFFNFCWKKFRMHWSFVGEAADHWTDHHRSLEFVERDFSWPWALVPVTRSNNHPWDQVFLWLTVKLLAG